MTFEVGDGGAEQDPLDTELELTDLKIGFLMEDDLNEG